MSGRILCINFRIRKDYKDFRTTSAFVLLNEYSAVPISAFVKFLSFGALNWMSVLLFVGYNDALKNCCR